VIHILFGWFFYLFNKALAGVNAAYVGILRWVVRLSVVVLLVYGGLVALTYVGFKAVPTGFIPQQDQGYLIAAVQLPDASSVDRTDAVLDRMAAIAKNVQGVHDTFGVTGFNLLTGTNQTNVGLMFFPLNTFEERAGKPSQTADALTGQLMGAFSQIQDAFIFVLSPPPVRGIGQAGGFKMQVEDRSGLATAQQLADVAAQLANDARKDPRLAQINSSFRASVPQLWANVDRTKAKQENVAVTDIFQTLQVYLGSFYINDFNYLGRTFRVVAQADAPFRARAADVARLKTRNLAGDMVPLGTVMDLKDIADADRINRYDLYPSGEVTGQAAPGVSSGTALDVMSELAAKDLPAGFSYEWTELAYQEETAGNTALFIFPLCVLFVFLTHSAEYESFALSAAIILIVPMCLLCGIAGVWFTNQWIMPMDDNIFTQIGFVVLAGMSVKNAVLIVEFAKQQQEHNPKLRAGPAAIEAARLRLRPILMTSFAFIFGVLPLLLAHGAGAEMRHALGTVVFYGMLGVTFFGVFFTPVFYTVIRKVLGDKPIRMPGSGRSADEKKPEMVHG
jgi:hydrophobe/amphiphile efflux-1 (HAE1) family protein